MATFSTYEGGEVIANGNGLNNAGFPSTGVLVAEFDASKRNLILANTDVAEIADIPAGTVINSVVVEVVSADAGGATLEIDAGATPVANAQAVAATGLTAGAITAPTLVAAGGKLTVALTAASGNLTTAKIRVFMDVTIVG